MSSPIRIDLPNYPYHVFCRGNNKQQIFLEDKDYERFLKKLGEYKEKLKVKIHAFVLMPNHFHLLAEPLIKGISAFMHPLMTSYTRYFNLKHGFIGHIFQSRFQSILIDKDNYFLTVSRYIHLNPVGGGMVKRAVEYKWSSFKNYLTEDSDSLIDRNDTLSYFSWNLTKATKLFRKFIESEEPIVNPQEEAKRGVLGKTSFLKKLTRATGIRF